VGGRSGLRTWNWSPRTASKRVLSAWIQRPTKSRGGGPSIPPGDCSPEGSLEAELVCLRDIPPSLLLTKE